MGERADYGDPDEPAPPWQKWAIAVLIMAAVVAVIGSDWPSGASCFLACTGGPGVGRGAWPGWFCPAIRDRPGAGFRPRSSIAHRDYPEWPAANIAWSATRRLASGIHPP